MNTVHALLQTTNELCHTDVVQSDTGRQILICSSRSWNLTSSTPSPHVKTTNKKVSATTNEPCSSHQHRPLPQPSSMGGAISSLLCFRQSQRDRKATSQSRTTTTQSQSLNPSSSTSGPAAAAAAASGQRDQPSTSAAQAGSNPNTGVTNGLSPAAERAELSNTQEQEAVTTGLQEARVGYPSYTV